MCLQMKPGTIDSTAGIASVHLMRGNMKGYCCENTNSPITKKSTACQPLEYTTLPITKKLSGHWPLGCSFYLWLSKVSTNERRCYLCNIFSHWLRLCSAIDKIQDLTCGKPNLFGGCNVIYLLWNDWYSTTTKFKLSHRCSCWWPGGYLALVHLQLLRWQWSVGASQEWVKWMINSWSEENNSVRSLQAMLNNAAWSAVVIQIMISQETLKMTGNWWDELLQNGAHNCLISDPLSSLNWCESLIVIKKVIVYITFM